MEREAGTYLRLRSIWLVQRASISAATPRSLMELLCRLQTEDRAHFDVAVSGCGGSPAWGCRH